MPTLVIDSWTLTEVAAIPYYLARHYPLVSLFPADDPWAEAQVISWMSFIASTLHPARRLGVEDAHPVYRLAEQRLGTGMWACGGYSIADIHLFRLFWRMRGSLGADPAMFSALTAHHDRMTERPVVRAALTAVATLRYALTG